MAKSSDYPQMELCALRGEPFILLLEYGGCQTIPNWNLFAFTALRLLYGGGWLAFGAGSTIVVAPPAVRFAVMCFATGSPVSRKRSTLFNKSLHSRAPQR